MCVNFVLILIILLTSCRLKSLHVDMLHVCNYLKQSVFKVCGFKIEFMSCHSYSSGAVQLAWQVQKTKNCIHKSAAAGAGASVQTE